MKIAITGGMGTGKSTVVKTMQRLMRDSDFAFYSYDDRVRQLYEDADFCSALDFAFGTHDRAEVAHHVFSDSRKMETLQTLTRNQMFEFCAEVAPRSVTEVPLLFEGGYAPYFDTVICVTCAPETQRQRIKARDSLTDQQIDQRLSRQWSSEDRIALSNYVVHTDDDRNVEHQLVSILFTIVNRT